MDKETLSNYGWIVIAVLVLSVMIALATPFGNFIKDAVWSTTQGLFSTGENALNTVGISSQEEKPLYSFGVLSDIHLKDSSYGTDESYSLSDYERALTFYKNNNVEFVSVTGDIIALNRTPDGDKVSAHNEWVSELKLFKQYNSTYFNKPVYAVTGNHDANPNGYYVQVNNSNKDTEGLNINIIADGYDGSKSAETVYKELTGQDLNYVVERGDDVFIYSSMYYWYYAKFNRVEDAEWLETQLEKYSDKRVFLFFHLPLKDTLEFTGGNQSSFYGTPNGFQSNYLMDQLVKKYKNVIWFSGHTHYDIALESTYGEDVYMYQSGDSMTMIHTPSCSHTRIPNGNSYSNVHNGSQGYLVDVYDDKIVVKGINFTALDSNLTSYTPIIEFTINI